MDSASGDPRSAQSRQEGTVSLVQNASENASKNVQANHIDTVNIHNHYSSREDGCGDGTNEEQSPSPIHYPEFRLCQDCYDMVRTDIGVNGDFITEKEDESFEDDEFDVRSRVEEALRNIQPNTEASLAALSIQQPAQSPCCTAAQDAVPEQPHTHPTTSSPSAPSTSPLSTPACTPMFTGINAYGIALGRVLLERGQHYWEVEVSMSDRWEDHHVLCEVGLLGPGEDMAAFIGLSSSKMGFGVEFMSCLKHKDLCLMAFEKSKVVAHTPTGLHPTRGAQVTMKVGLLLNIEQGRLVILDVSTAKPFCSLHRLQPPLTPSFSIRFTGHVHLRLMTGDNTSVNRRKLQKL